MKVTVITVAYNSARTIGDTLASVRDQTHNDIEHIVIDGASKDATLQIVGQYRDSVIRCVSEPDRGIYDAMNKGLRLATGDLVGFLNADDVYADSTALATMAEAASEAPPADAVYADLVYVDEDKPDRVLRHWRSGPFHRASLRYGWMPPHPTFYVRRGVFDRIGPFDDRLRIAADYEFMLRVLTTPGINIAYVPEVLVRMRAGGASNRSLSAMIRKSREDLMALRRNAVGGWLTLAAKNLRKIPQFLHGRCR